VSNLDPAVRRLLEEIRDALQGMADWRAIGVSSAASDALDGDPAAAADWLHDFMVTRARGGDAAP
jgi:hypothetical protein